MVKDTIEALDRIVAWLGLVRKRREERNEHLDAALEAVMIAANRTRAYLALKRVRDATPNRHHEYQNLDVEHDLTEAWERAGTKLHQVRDDEDTAWLARRCFEKAGYWADPRHIRWEDDAAAEAAGIKLDSIVNDILNLLCKRKGG